MPDVKLRSDRRVLFRAASQKHLKLEDDVVEVFLHLRSNRGDSKVENDRARPRLDGDTEKTRSDEPQRCLACLKQEVVPPQQITFLGRRELRLQYCLAG